jgi:hypothetical protein
MDGEKPPSLAGLCQIHTGHTRPVALPRSRRRKRGRPSSRRLPDALRAETVGLIREKYGDFGPTLVREKLVEVQGIDVSVETLCQWMIGDGVWLPRDRSFRARTNRVRAGRASVSWSSSTVATTSGSRPAGRAACCSEMALSDRSVARVAQRAVAAVGVRSGDRRRRLACGGDS